VPAGFGVADAPAEGLAAGGRATCAPAWGCAPGDTGTGDADALATTEATGAGAADVAGSGAIWPAGDGGIAPAASRLAPAALAVLGRTGRVAAAGADAEWRNE
jgi:hypothetical protein